MTASPNILRIIEVIEESASLADAIDTLTQEGSIDPTSAAVLSAAATAAAYLADTPGAITFTISLSAAAAMYLAVTELLGDPEVNEGDFTATAAAIAAALAIAKSPWAVYFSLLSLAPTMGHWLSNFEIPYSVFDYLTKAGILPGLKDPLALDLNGDGIATISANEDITFDHNNARIKYGTGWINPNDGWLALDRNGNGKIDSGRELFGDSTRKLDGNFAAHAYDALKSFDTNNDGKVDMADATGDTDSDGVMEEGETYWDINNNNEYDAGVDKTFADLRVWVDANSNAVTDSGELKTLSELGIVSIGTGKTTVNATDEHGNVNTFKGNYTTTSGEVIDGTRSFNLLENKFNRDTVDHPNIPPDVAALPNMQGSGAVRNLHEAMSLGTPQSLALKTTVQAFNNATTRGAQYALIDKLLMQWGSTSGFEDLAQRLENMNGGIHTGSGSYTPFSYQYRLTTGAFWEPAEPGSERNNAIYLLNPPSVNPGSGDGLMTTDPDYYRTLPAADNLFVNNPEVLEGQTPAQAAKIQALAKVRVLEVFNNAQFFNFNSSATVSGTDDPNTSQDERIGNTMTVNSPNTSKQRSGQAGAVGMNVIVLTEDDFPIPSSNYIHASYDQLLMEAT